MFDHDQALFGLDWNVDYLANKIGSISRTAIDEYAIRADNKVKVDIVKLAERWENTIDVNYIITIIDELPPELKITREESYIIKHFISTRIKNISFLAKHLLKV